MSPGEWFGQLMILRILPGHHCSGRLAVCRCVCGNEITARCVELTAGRRKTCTGKHSCRVCGRRVANQGEWSHARTHRHHSANAGAI